MLSRTIIKLNNVVTRRRRVRVRPAELLLILPHCLQRGGCPRNIVGDPRECTRCGGCAVGALLALCERRGVAVAIAAGGQQALARARAPGVRAVVAVACHKELIDGLRATFPRPLLAIPNEQPHGPCRETTVTVAAVEAAIDSLLADS